MREWIGLAVIALPCLLYSMDLTVLYLAVPQITEALSPSASELLWIVDIYGFMVAGWLITMGTLGDRIGRRKLLLIGAAAFGVTSLIVAFAPSAKALIIARAAQGIAGATLAPSTLALIRNMFLDDRQRTFAIGVWMASFSAGAIFGPLIGGFILDHFWWGAVFLINVPMMILLLATGPFLLPEYRDPHPGRMDVVSALLSLAAVLMIIFGMKRIAEDGYSWGYALTMLAGVAIGYAFIDRQRRLANPLIDISLFKSRTFSAALGVNVLGLFTILGAFFLIAQYLQLVLGMSALEAGLWTAPTGAMFTIGSMLAPVLIKRWQPGTIIAIGFVITGLGFAIMTQLSQTEGPWLLFLGMMIFSTGLSPIGTTTTDIVMSKVPPERAGSASAISETSFEFGGAAGIAVLGSLVAAAYRNAIAGDPLPGVPAEAVAHARMTLGGAVEAAKGLSGAPAIELLTSARSAFVHATEIVCGLAALSAFTAAILAHLLLREKRA